MGMDILATIIWRILRKNGYRKTKLMRKPGLTKVMRAKRLQWCLAYQDWILEDWKRVIWIDKILVIFNFRRSGYRVWRKFNEALVKSCIRER